MDNFIRVWEFHDAPEELRKLSTNGGDEDWLVLIPASLKEKILQYGTPSWIERMGACDVDQHDLENGDVVFIGAHS